MKIAILGTGAIGSLFAARLSESSDNKILCVVKSQTHCDNINSNGITVMNSPDNLHTYTNLRAVTGTENESPADFVLISVKAQNTLDAVTQHKSLFGNDTTVLTLQNGYGNHNDILTVCGNENILIGTTAMGVNINDDGVIVCAGSGPTIAGALEPDSDAAAARLTSAVELLKSAGFDVSATTDARDAVFRKLLINVGINAVCALNDTENRYININKEMNMYARELVYEAVLILDIAGYTYDKDEIWNNVQAVAKKTGNNICSMLQDVRNGRSTEIRKINGAIVEIARSERIDAPLNRQIVSEIENRFGE